MTADSRLQQAIDDITEAYRLRKIADSCIDDARTELANIIDEKPAGPLAPALLERANEYLNGSLIGDVQDGPLIGAQALIIRVQEALTNA